MSASPSPRTASAPDGAAARRFDLERHDALIAFVQTRAGRCCLLLAALAAVAPHFGGIAALAAVAGAMAAAAWPARRGAILFGLTWISALLNTSLGEVDTADNIRAVLQQEQIAPSMGTMLSLGFLCLLFAVMLSMLRHVQKRPQSLLARRPLLTLLSVQALLCAVGSFGLLNGWPRALLWSAVFVFAPYLWFLPFAIADLRSRAPSPLAMQMATLRPFWSPSYLPFGKGAAFLRKHLSLTPMELTVTQIKGLKLLIWANLLFILRDVLMRVFADGAGIPDPHDAIDALLAGHAYPAVIGWAALVLATATYALQVAAWADLFIGIARLAGYRLPRGSWRPLEARTLMDYFNRFHYYFKELLVDLFFMPTFFRMFRAHPRLRMFFATFMAAGVGNAVWHFSRNLLEVAVAGPANAFASYTSYLFYALVLAIGVGLSQVRANRGMRPSSSFTGRLGSFVFVWSFIVCIHIFGDGTRVHTLGQRFKFMASLFGVTV
ncbi:hypothetical protein SAMN06265795_11342 [Noviherbaspirillum humi]|uniref:MBOAT, membrane-bound O-acyltransferase family n=1 Tax=Noviherbaspirillum humi TaxID=1688639 RepID=A0A239JPK3_9BURK|nr:hypothetical protein [Noviherbaspirillum humi]SNT07689.1 hypothetical protein SAMN06265795_11342 [Noviherbaspirillum humi]